MTAWFRENRTAILLGLIVFGVLWVVASWADGGLG